MKRKHKPPSMGKINLYEFPKTKSRKKKKKKKQIGAILMRDFFGEKDYSDMTLKIDHTRRPCIVCPDGTIVFETFTRIYEHAYDFLVSIAEPVARTNLIHEYKLTRYSLYAAVATGLQTQQIINILGKLSKYVLPDRVRDFIIDYTSTYGKVRMILWKNDFYLESEHPKIINKLIENSEIFASTIRPTEEEKKKSNYSKEYKLMYRIGITSDSKMFNKIQKSIDRNLVRDDDDDDDDDDLMDVDDEDEFDELSSGRKTARYYQLKVKTEKVETVLFTCREINYPLLEEYEFRNDTVNKTLNFDLKPFCKIRPYQEKSLSKMFANGTARSGLIVLPCGAGKTLVGITASCRIKKSVFVITISNLSVEQWRNEFLYWTTVQDSDIVRFTSMVKEKLPDDPTKPCIVITTYAMITTGGRKSDVSREVHEKLRSRDWGCLLLDEVHVAPAKTFRTSISIIKAHCKLGLTATLLREDQKEGDLYYMIGPKHYEANWLDLQKKGHLADVKCTEIWCPMDPRYYKGYLDSEKDQKKRLFYLLNPYKMKSCEFLMKYHEERGDKIIVFADNVFALRTYAILFGAPMIYGDTKPRERFEILNKFKNTSTSNVLFLSKVGDSAIDIPNANVIIQVSSHFGSRRQEAQRLGRILRSKEIQAGVSNVAYFYTLISKDTKEMFYSTKRQRFLIEQGYSFQVINDLHKKIDGHDFIRSVTPDYEEKLLEVIKVTDHREGNTEEVEVVDKRKKRKGSLLGITSGRGLVYVEAPTSSSARKRHPLFRKRMQKKKR